MNKAGVLAPSFASRLDATSRSRNSLDMNLPPLVAGANEFRIDVTPMLLHGSLVMDRSAFEFITSNRYSKTQYLARQLADFWEAGLVELQECGDWNDDQRQMLDEERERALLERRGFWLGELRQTVEWWEANAADYAEAYGGKLLADASVPWAIGAVLDHFDSPYHAREVRRVRDAIFHDETDEDKQFADIALRAVLNYTNSNRLNAARFRSPVFDWTDMQGFMTASDRIIRTYASSQLSTARFVITDIARIDLGDLSSSQVIAMLKDSRIRSFRAYVDQCHERGRTAAEVEKGKLYEALIDHRVNLMTREKFKFITRLASAAILGNLDVFQDTLTHLRVPNFAVKTTDDFLKSTIEEASQGASLPSDMALQAIYSLRYHSRR